MIKRWTETELTAKLTDLTVVCDTREKENKHVTSYFDRNKIPYISRNLNVGDYSAQIGDQTMETEIVIERKHNLDEICGNFTANRERFEREFLRAKAVGTKVFLIIEDASWDDVYLGNYRSKLSAKSLVASLLAWQVRFNITVLFCNPANTGRLIYHILYYAAREQLKNG